MTDLLRLMPDGKVEYVSRRCFSPSEPKTWANDPETLKSRIQISAALLGSSALIPTGQAGG
jgi:hypothetical protein